MFGLVSLPDDWRNSLFQLVTWRMAMWAKMTHSPVVDRMEAPAMGQPIALTVGTASGRMVYVMLDTPRFDHYAERIVEVVPHGGTVLEIGGGYGGTALQLLRHDPTLRVVMVDIPETLYLAAYFLSEAGVPVAWWDDAPEARSHAGVVLLPAQELAQCAPRPDLVFSAHTLSGLDRATGAGYLAWLAASGARYFYHDDVTETVTGVWMTDTFPEVLASDLVPVGYREVWRERTPWMAIVDRFCEFFYEVEGART